MLKYTGRYALYSVELIVMNTRLKFDPSEFTRAIISRTLGGADYESIAYKRWGDQTGREVAKAAVPAIGTNETGSPAAREFFKQAMQQSILGRIDAKQVPFNTRVIGNEGGVHGYWTGEANPIPVSRPSLAGIKLPSRKVAAIICSTVEAVEAMGIVAESGLQSDLMNAVAGSIDEAAFDLENSGGENRPASILHDVEWEDTAGDPAEDVASLLTMYEGNLGNAVLLMHPKTAITINRKAGTPDPLDLNSGSFMGIPALVGQGFPDNALAILDTKALALAYRGFDIDVANHASIEMVDDPEQPAEMVNLWQTNTVAWKSTAEANWHLFGKNRAAVITDIDY